MESDVSLRRVSELAAELAREMVERYQNKAGAPPPHEVALALVTAAGALLSMAGASDMVVSLRAAVDLIESQIQIVARPRKAGEPIVQAGGIKPRSRWQA